MKVIYLLVMILIGGNVAQGAEELLLRHIGPESEKDERNWYFVDLLRLGIQKTEAADGPFRLQASQTGMPQARALDLLRQNRGIDVVWSMTSGSREAAFHPIRIPLLKGLLGHRVFIIRDGEQSKFRSIKTLDDLKVFKAGQGHDWPDTKILRANGLRVVVGSSYLGLFSMLQHNRFDFFPRGVNEPWAEVESHADKNLVVESTLMLQYPAPIYFFVNKQNLVLAERLERGLRSALKDGSFDRLFQDHPSNKAIFTLANMEERKIIRLDNPLLTPETPLDDETLWYVPKSIAKN